MNLNIAILEDNNSDYNHLKNLIQNWADKSGNITRIQWFRTGEQLLQSKAIDTWHILFSDIELTTETDADALSGLETCIELRKQTYQGEIIFLTAFSEYVFEGYNVLAFNYLLKPIHEEQLENCMNKYISIHSADFYYYHKDNDIIQIAYNDIISISKDGHDAIIQTKDALFVERVSLNEIANRLPPQFVRCHKSCIINMLHVYGLSGTIIQLSNQKKQQVGRSYLSSIREHLIALSTE
jgi:DNA-binding LytR/AlgR family response regulator